MATNTEAIIYDGLANRMGAFVTSLPVAYPNLEFKPISTGYIRVDHLPNIVEQVTLGDLGKNRHQGIFQVSVMWPEDEGTVRPLELAGDIVNHFKRGTTITQDGLDIRIIAPPEVASMIQDPPFAQYPVSIAYQVDSDN